ncbi:type III secretion system export apparatus subunit SctV [Candidatus Ichthyocystis hellenicum]|uniref:Type III secretion system protein V n=1 Tax=Candidatus Ichthyocystis hellenicum TaxID=1561003 RepID=A0A0S4M245_9BURK|nr:type III secretion system export apparatus subunit SctV [Candidatus Ichthyocystis hellenicum]CUT17087.1 type III secretion system protein V [Candidatus Ichthyocystis hellenicum]
MQSMLIRLISTATKRNDLVVAAAIVMVVFMMIIPLPTSLVDILIAVNMSVASILLMVSLYLPNPLAFSSFPSVLLITTLFRLGISIATTRLILLNGDAGHIIYTFGFFVVGGNLVVGLVVFLILTVVQFIVITKGAERVSEVAARFSLDAMPGKQMSIDGDMRAGAINMEEAKRRRFLVEKESQLYGAMDGAMKFVKGDAIAGLIIVSVNLIGGIIIGMLQKDMTAGDAMRAYSVLSIGDGLISQIPALFISICAGLIVTRVSSVEGGPSNVGKDIGEQIFAQPRALIIGSAIMLGLGFVPGMPTTVFFLIAAVIGLIGYILLTRHDEIVKAQKSMDQKEAEKAAGSAAADSKAEEDREFAPTVPLILEVSKGLDQTFSTSVLNDELVKIRRALYLDLGVPFPGIQLRYTDRLPEETYVIQLNEVPISQGNLKPRHVLVRENKKTLQTLNIDFIEGESFLGGIATIWVREELEPTLTQANITCMRITQILTYHLATILKKYATDFLGIQESKALLTSMESKFPDLIKEIMRVMPIQKIAEILQRLVSEDISIRNIRTVVEALIEWGQKEKDSVLLTEYVRTALKRQISHKFAQEKNSLPAYLFSPTVEDMVRNAIRQTSAGSYLALDPQSSKRLVANIKKTIGDVQSVAKKPVLLTSMDIRRYIRKLIEQEMYEIPVLSYQELTQDVTVQPLGRVEM